MIQFFQGANFTHLIDLNETLDVAKQSDTIIICIGENSYAETIGNIRSLMLNEAQLKLARELLELKKPTIIVYLGGRPRVMTDIAERADAVLVGFFPGERGGEAIADIILGKYNPNGKMPITYPRHPNGCTTYDHKPLEFGPPDNIYAYLFPFGHGLSYTRFDYISLELSTKRLYAPANLIVTILVRNVGQMDGKEVVMLYLNDEYGSDPRQVRQLKRFTKIDIPRGTLRIVQFTLTMNDLSFVNRNSRRVYEAGRFNVYVGNLSESFDLFV